MYDRLVEQRRQKKLDRGQNKKIKELEQRLTDSESEKKKIREGEKGGKEGKDDSDGDDNLRGSLERSGGMIQQEYDRYYGKIGKRFAQGDRKFNP